MRDPIQTCRVVQVIHTAAVRGRGTESDPYRRIECYWSLDGELLVELDPHTKEPS